MIIHCAYDELVSLDQIKEHPDNNNRHSIEQIERLAKIIDFNGITSPITISKRTGYMTKGHGRKLAAEYNKYEKFPVQYIDYRDEAHEYSDLTADNEIARWAELDRQAVYEKIEGLEDFDIELLGIEDFEVKIDKLEPQSDEDEVPEVEDPITKRGDIWLLGTYYECEKCKKQYSHEEGDKMNKECPCDL